METDRTAIAAYFAVMRANNTLKDKGKILLISLASLTDDQVPFIATIAYHSVPST
jgi:hypothetical protein